jgi:peptidoglycan hydrolase-like protein with peptidoglycan-binding domain
VPPEASGADRPGGRRWVAAGVVVVAGAVAVVTAGVTGAFGGAASPGAAAGSADRTSTALVTRQSLSSQDQVDATLGYGGSYKVTAQGGGTVTWLPAAGRVIREGQVLYRVGNGTPVFLLYGRVPAWRALAVGAHGADVRQLNTALVKLGYATSALLGPRDDWKFFTAETASALAALQVHMGLTVTGTLPLGQAAFLPAAIRVAAVDASLGAAATGPVLSVTSARRVVTIALDADQQTEVKAGDKVSITLPDGRATPGRVSSVGKVATGSGSSATVTVLVALRHPAAAAGLDQAPVDVAITTGSVASALTVPVDALLARADGRYAVEVTGAGGHHLVPVSPGLFDDAAGLVQVSGSGLSAGQRVVVPAL